MRSSTSVVGTTLAVAIGAVVALRVMQLEIPNRGLPGTSPEPGFGRCPKCQKLGLPLDTDALEFECLDHGPFTSDPPDKDPRLDG